MGFLIVLDGVGGMGKSTQQDLLLERLQREYGEERVRRMRFPRYGTPPYGPLIRAYLDGALGDPNQVSPYFAGMLYAQDRQLAAPMLRKMLEGDKIVVADRYLGSNLAYQGAKCQSTAEFLDYLNWQINTEYCLLKVVQEDLMIVLHAPAQISQALADRRQALTDNVHSGRDGHEKDTAYVQRIVDTYLNLTDIMERWEEVDCTSEDGLSLRSEEDISDDIWGIVQTALLEWKVSSAL